MTPNPRRNRTVAREAGVTAGRSTHPGLPCPYDPGTLLYNDWQAGYADGRRARNPNA